MAMVTISGFPSSGKSTRALELSKFFSQKIQESTLPSIKKLKILIINDESLNISKSSYDGKPIGVFSYLPVCVCS